MLKANLKSVKPKHGAATEDLAVESGFSKLTRVIGRGIYAAEMRGSAPLKTTYAVVDDRTIAVSLEDGRKVAVPLDWYPRLLHATPAERNDWRLIMGGRAVSWRGLGIAISVKAMLEGVKAHESRESLKKWLAQRKPMERKRRAG
jgi:hypothetical protein